MQEALYTQKAEPVVVVLLLSIKLFRARLSHTHNLVKLEKKKPPSHSHNYSHLLKD